MQETKITSCILQNYCSENFPKNDRLSEMGLWPSELFRKQKKKINYKNSSALRMIIAHFDKKENYSRQVHTAIPVFWKKELDTE